MTSTDLYDAFGKKRAGPADVVGFGGQAGYYTEAETGLVLCTNRHYNPQTGRFLTRDPMGYGGGVNLYGYVGNNPINSLDPLGLWNGYKWIYTGDGNASDDVYDAALNQGAATLSFEGQMMHDLNRKTLPIIAGAVGIGSTPFWGVPKPVAKALGARVFTQAGSSGNTSVARLTSLLADKYFPGSPFAARMGTGANTVKDLYKAGKVGSVVRGGAVALLYYEAGLAIYTGHEAMKQPLVDDDDAGSCKK